jgi:hypothetical protein
VCLLHEVLVLPARLPRKCTDRTQADVVKCCLHIASQVPRVEVIMPTEESMDGRTTMSLLWCAILHYSYNARL